MAKFKTFPNPNVSWEPVSLESLDLGGMSAAVIGGTGGIGRAVARTLNARGAAVTVVGRTFREDGTSGIDFICANLGSMAEAKRVGRELPAEKLDLMLLSTGTMPGPQREVTSEGVEIDLAVSYLSRFIIVREIAPRLGTERHDRPLKPRIFVMGFPGAGASGILADFNSEREYVPMRAHMNTVAGNEVLVLDTAHRHPQINIYGLNPGMVKSNIRANMLGGSGSFRQKVIEGLIGILNQSADAYAARMVPLFVSPDIEGASGTHFNNKAEPILSSPSLTEDVVAEHIAASEKLVNMALEGAT